MTAKLLVPEASAGICWGWIGVHSPVLRSARQVEQALLAGARYILFWCVYDNEEKGTYTFSYPTEAENDDLKGLWLVRSDGTLPELYNYCKSILSTSIDDCRRLRGRASRA